ncbi:MAG: hypothetical protein C1941_02395 [Prosthecochloris sp.]|nr:hypothetical protein [Prosthecochloris sp.]
MLLFSLPSPVLPTIHYPLSTIHYPLSTIHYPLFILPISVLFQMYDNNRENNGTVVVRGFQGCRFLLYFKSLHLDIFYLLTLYQSLDVYLYAKPLGRHRL